MRATSYYALIASLLLVSLLTADPGPTFPSPGASCAVDTNGVSVGDFNEDGIPDLIQGVQAAQVNIGFGRGNGTFVCGSAQTSSSLTGPAAVVDLNDDGHSDFVVSLGVYWLYGYLGDAIDVVLGNGDGTFDPPVEYEAPYAYSVVWADFDEDGAKDVLVGGANVNLLRGVGDGQLQPREEVTPQNLLTVVVGDFNRDGHDDFAGGDYQTDTAVVMLGNGDGTFVQSDYPVGQYPYTVAVGDVDGDGFEDLALANYGGDDVSLLLGHGDGTFAPDQRHPVLSGPHGIAIDDLDGDGKGDVVVSHFDSYSVSVLGGTTDGLKPAVYFESARAMALDVLIADLNGDGKKDLAKDAGWSGEFVVMEGNGDGTFLEPLLTTDVSGNSAVVGDFDQDSDRDVALAGGGGVVVLLGGGDGNFAPLQSLLPPGNWKGIALGDFDDDGNEDLAVTDEVGNAVEVLPGNGDGSFGPASSLAVGDGPGCVVSGDLDHDGHDDLVVVNELTQDLSVLLADGQGGFAPDVRISLSRPACLAVGLVDGDDDPDLVVTRPDAVSLSVLLGNGDGTFVETATLPAFSKQSRVALGDVNGDQLTDVVAYAGTGIAVFSFWPGNGDGSFGPETVVQEGPKQNYQMYFADVDGDGEPELIGRTPGGKRIAVRRINGDGTFDVLGEFLLRKAGPIGVDDFDGDGRNDLAAFSAPTTVLLNQCLRSNLWVEADKSTLAWRGVCGAQSYSVYRESLSTMYDGNYDGLPDDGYGECVNHLDDDTTDTLLVDGDVPLPGGGGFCYLVGFVDPEGEHGLGATSAGLPREVFSPCP